jgi:hypothetical protein
MTAGGLDGGRGLDTDPQSDQAMQATLLFRCVAVMLLQRLHALHDCMLSSRQLFAAATLLLFCACLAGVDRVSTSHAMPTPPYCLAVSASTSSSSVQAVSRCRSPSTSALGQALLQARPSSALPQLELQQ